MQEADALVLSGGSAFGLDAASGVADALRAQGRGFPVGDQTVPIVPGAILFDLLNGGDKDWPENPYKRLGAEALAGATDTFALGSEGAGTGALIADLKGGLGSASATWEGYTVGALVAVNALGRVTLGNGPQFWAAPFEMDAEFGGLGIAQTFDPTPFRRSRATAATPPSPSSRPTPHSPKRRQRAWPLQRMTAWRARSGPATHRWMAIWSLRRPPGRGF